MITRLVFSALALSVVNLKGNESLNGKSNLAAPTKAVSNQLTQGQRGYPVRGEIRQTYRLAPKANIEVTGIGGSVDVETTNGGTAEIRFVRQARTQADYDCETIAVQDSPTNLVVRHQTKTGKQCRVSQAREQMKLVVPRSANLTFSDLNGGFSVGATDGFLRLKNIRGSVRIEAAQAAEINSVAGGVKLEVVRLSPAGIVFYDIAGSVELGVAEKLNADLRIKGPSGKFEIDVPNAQTTVFSTSDDRIRLNAGGPDISFSSIKGSVTIRRHKQSVKTKVAQSRIAGR